MADGAADLRSRLATRALGFALALVLAGCASSLPTPVLGTHPPGCAAFIEVPHPPPPARVEMIPDRPREGVVWVDGEWVWRGKRWEWDPGGWVIPPDGYFAPWVLVRRDDGSLYHARSRWFDREGKPLRRPVPIEAGQVEPVEEPGGPAPRCEVPD